jgi:hypothetical protein
MKYIDFNLEPKLISDPLITLKEWADLIDFLRQKYGDDTQLVLDAGHNNIDMSLLCPDKKPKKS